MNRARFNEPELFLIGPDAIRSTVWQPQERSPASELIREHYGQANEGWVSLSSRAADSGAGRARSRVPSSRIRDRGMLPRWLVLPQRASKW